MDGRLVGICGSAQKMNVHQHMKNVLSALIVMAATLPCGSLSGQSLAEPDVPTALYERKGDKIVDAPLEDFQLAKTYHAFKEKGALVKNQRITILTKKIRYKVGEPVRVLHVLESVKAGIEVFVMGPKTIYGEYVDGKLVTAKGPGMEGYDGMVVSERPIADFNYEITTYTFKEPGEHTIQWKGGGHPFQGSLDLESNVIKLQVKQE